MKIMLNGIVLEQVNLVKCATLLGVYIDEHISWDNHIQEVACKVLLLKSKRPNSVTTSR